MKKLELCVKVEKVQKVETESDKGTFEEWKISGKAKAGESIAFSTPTDTGVKANTVIDVVVSDSSVSITEFRKKGGK